MGKSLLGKMFAWSRRSAMRSRRFGVYDVLKLVHEGEKACVYQGQSKKDGSHVAIKAYKPLYNRTARRICKRYHLRCEGSMGVLINPDGEAPDDWPIVCTLGFGHEFNDPAKCYYLVQEYIDGVNVKHLVGCDDPQLPKRRMHIALAVSRALSIIHDRGLIHRDVCMDNIILRRDGRAKLIDLGFMAPKGIAFPEKSGTPSYMAPEQFNAEPLDATADIYGFGVLLFELYTRDLPFKSVFPTGKAEVVMRRTSELQAQHLKEPPPRPSEIVADLPDGIEPIILKCLEKDRGKRYANMRHLLSDLSAVNDPKADRD